MGKQEFEASRIDGPHHALAAMVGAWRGEVRVWFEPDKVADQASISGSIRAVLGGRFVMHEYETLFFDEPQQGIAIHGWHIDAQRHESAWIDSAHNGTAIMVSIGDKGSASNSVLGHYGGLDGEPAWGWRTQIDMPDADHLTITAYNMPPGEAEAKALEIRYTRVDSENPA